MSESTALQFVGLDVHRDSVAIALAKPDGQPARSLATVPNDIPRLIGRLRQLGPVESLRYCYEAGPTGFDLARRLSSYYHSTPGPIRQSIHDLLARRGN